MQIQAAAYPDWKAPAEDGTLLVWPAPGQLLRDTAGNAARLTSETGVNVQNVPLAEVRRAQRRWLGVADEESLIATGHQTELYHPGVWAKDVLTGLAAAKLGGRAVHFAVDTDQPKHLSLRWPGGAFPITDDPRLMSAEWSGLLDGATPAHLAAIESSLRAASSNWGFEPAALDFLATLKSLALETPPLSAAITHATHKLDWSLGLRHDALLVSPILTSEPYLLFAHHVLARAGAFAGDYNGALAGYRQANKVRSPMRPMPDLLMKVDVCEAPFWLDDLTSGRRSRASVAIGAGDDRPEMILPNGERFTFDLAAEGWGAAGRLLAFCRRNNVRLSPRALTLTLFFRLFVADQFVHGIGGGRYDQVNDALIERHFGIAPPKFSVTTATMFFPAAVGRSRVCLPCLAQEGHKLKHRLLGDAKRALVEAIAALPRRSSERQIRFGRMHGRLAAAAVDNPVVRDWEKRLRLAREENAHDQTLFDREMFYAIQPRQRLLATIAKYEGEFAGA